MTYSVQEKAQILSEFHRNRSITTTQRWVRRVMRKKPPSRNDILRWDQSFLERGSLAHRGGNGRPRTSQETVDKIQELFRKNPKLSLRAASASLNVPTTTLHRILHESLFLFPYKLQNLQHLHESDKTKRLEFVQHCQRRPEGYSEYLSKIVFSDECLFRISGSVNKQNVRIWGTERPTENNPVIMHSPSLMVWCAMSKERIIGPYFFENENVSGESYRNMLIHYAFPRLNNLRDDYIFQQDGAPAHYSNRVKAYLNNKRPNNWIGRGGPVAWPPRSPDLTPCDFFLWGHIKSQIYSTPVESVEELKLRIRSEVRKISPETLEKVWENTQLRLNYIRRVKGAI